MKTWLTVVSLGLAVAAAIFLLIVPAYSGFNGTRATHATLMDVNGQWVIIPVMFPVVVALMPLLFPGRVVRIITTIIIGGFSLIASFTIGLFYLPAAVVMLMATSATRPANPDDVRQ
jgi:hypothetical protein